MSAPTKPKSNSETARLDLSPELDLALQKPPRIRDKDQERKWALYMRNAAMLLKTHFRSMEVSLADFKGKRKGDDALILRRIYLAFLRERIPTWFLAETFQMDRGTPTKDQLAIEEWARRDTEFELYVELLFDGLDQILQTNPEAMVESSREQLQIDRDIAKAEKALKAAQKAVSALQSSGPLYVAWMPAEREKATDAQREGRAHELLRKGVSIVDVSRETALSYRACAVIQTSLDLDESAERP